MSEIHHPTPNTKSKVSQMNNTHSGAGNNKNKNQSFPANIPENVNMKRKDRPL